MKIISAGLGAIFIILVTEEGNSNAAVRVQSLGISICGQVEIEKMMS
jgi:hypothetical protein